MALLSRSENESFFSDGFRVGRLLDAFNQSANRASFLRFFSKKHRILHATNSFLSDLDQFETQDDLENPENRDFIRQRFDAFLEECDFQMARFDFQTLLDDVEGKKRDDGTTPWYHQLSPIVMLLSYVRKGTLTLDMLDQYGGLETAIRTHLNHDKVEDTKITPKGFEKDLSSQAADFPGFSDRRRSLEEERATRVYNNVMLMTKKSAVSDEYGNLVYKDGKIVRAALFPTDLAYIHNMLTSKNANPVVCVLKLGDGNHNVSSMLGAPRFDAKRRLKYCDERENMYGPRSGMTDKWKNKWPEFKQIISDFDDFLGVTLYINFGFLEYVDLAYGDDEKKFQPGHEILPGGFGEYLKRVVDLDIPRAFNPTHQTLDRMHKLQEEHAGSEYGERIDAFLKYYVYPVFADHKDYFPEIFSNEGGNVVGNDNVQPV